jgi:microcystin-dependent protein
MATNTPCDWIDTIDGTQCIGDSLDTINQNFTNLQNAICGMYDLFPPGLITLYSGTTAPSGWAICNGAYLSTSTYPALYSIIGEIYGPLSGGNFQLPDFRGRTAIGVNPAPLPGLSQRMLASTGGVETVALDATQNASHIHSVTDPGHTHTGTANAHNHTVNDPGHVHTLNDTGHAHNVYYGIDTATTTTGSLSAGSIAQNKTPSVGQINYGSANATSNTAVYQHQHSIGPFYDNNAGGALANTCPGAYWLANTNTGGTQFLAGATGSGYYFTSVDTKTTANPTQVTINDAQSNVTLLAAATNIAIEATTVDISVTSAATGITLGSSGSGAPHENLAPYLVLNYIIKLL